ncbi:MAG: hypothetical protein JOZ60_06670 [Verrucomicrobia bacterium]|nr:hypothetical protein [Verrucomicrobiota bacterium]
MTGIVVRASERVIAAEFFELLKTPWEFFQTGKQYDVLICTSEELPCEAAPLSLVFGGEQMPFDSEQKKQVRPHAGGFVLSDEGKRLPIYGTVASFSGNSNSLLTLEGTNEPAAYVSRCGGATVLRIGYNLFSEVRFLLTEGQPTENSVIPTLDEHIACLRGWITLAGIPLVEVPPVPVGYKFMACLTHDLDHPVMRNHWCDHTMYGFLYRATIGTLRDVFRRRKSLGSLRKNLEAVCLLPFVHLGLAKDFWRGFDRYLEMVEVPGSTFFVIPRSDYAGRTSEGPAPSLRRCRYEVDQLAPQLRRIVAAGGEIGLHGLDAWLDNDEGRKEREIVSRAVGVSIRGVRMHWLFFDSNSPAALDQAGFDYDTTVGYRETVGYRAGTAQAYKPPGATKLLELPLHVMDTALFYSSYLRLREQEAEGLVWRLMDDAERSGGALTINWHDRSIAPDRLWEDFYLKMLRELRSRGAWLPTSSKAVAWFRSRRAAVIESARSPGGALRVQGRAKTSEEVPGLQIRIHKPRAQSLAEATASRKRAEFVDVPFAGTTELNLAI